MVSRYLCNCNVSHRSIHPQLSHRDVRDYVDQRQIQPGISYSQCSYFVVLLRGFRLRKALSIKI
jgi:hypothetical protein